MAKRKVRVAIVGLGFGAEFIPIYQLHPEAEMYAICQRNPEKMKAVGDYFGVERRFEAFEDVLRDPNVDFVHINTPIPAHGPMSIAALKAHLEQELSLATLAAVGEMSLAHFSRLFKHATGLAPHQYVIACRMEQAKRLLAETDVSLSEIALQVGCTD